MSNLVAPLRMRAYRRLLAAYAINALGTWAGQIALSVMVLAWTRSPASVAGVMIAGQFLPSLIAPSLVARAEAMGARAVLPVLLSAEALLFAALALLAGPGRLGLLLMIVAVDGVLSQVTRALLKGSMVSLTGPAGLRREGNVLLMWTFTGCMTIGPVAAGVMIGALSARAGLLGDAISFGVAAVVVAGHAQSGVGAAAQDGRSGRLREALSHVAARPQLRGLLAMTGLLGLASAAILPLEIVLVTRTMHASAAAFGVVLALWGLGAVAGSALLSRLRGRSPIALVAASFAVMALAYLGMGLAPSVAVVYAFSFLGGIGNGVEGFASMTAIQDRTADAFQTRIAGLVEAVNSSTTGLGFLGGGLVASLVGPRAVYVVSGAAILAGALALLHPRCLASVLGAGRAHTVLARPAGSTVGPAPAPHSV